MRLDKFLTEMLYGTRSEVKKIIRSGFVTVNNTVVIKPELKVDELSDTICVGNEEVLYSKYVYYMMNKPTGYISATKDNSQKTVIDLLKKDMGNIKNGVFPVGRLDIDTEGLLLLTNDGSLAHMLLSPVKHVEKVYYLIAEGIITEESIKHIEKGIDIGDDTPALPARIENIKTCQFKELGEYEKGIITESHNAREISGSIFTSMELVLHEGRYHQVKRMVKAAGSQVLYLKRIRMGTLLLDEKLAPGQCRKLTDEETRSIKNCCNNYVEFP